MKAFFRRYCKNKMAVAGAVILGVYLFLAVFANVLFAPELVNYQDYSAMMEGPGAAHWFGTDALGRDLFIRLVYGSRVSLLIGFAATALGLVIGSFLGALSAYLGGVIDQVLMRVLDVMYCVPFTLLAMLLVALLGRDTSNLILAVAIANILTFAKITRGCVLSITEQDYIKAARACGTGTWKIVVSHILPNAVSVPTTNAAFTMASSMLAAAGLSFIGVGIQPPNPEWGALLAEGRTYIQSEPRLVILPALCIIFATVAVTLIGDGIRDALSVES